MTVVLAEKQRRIIHAALMTERGKVQTMLDAFRARPATPSGFGNPDNIVRSYETMLADIDKLIAMINPLTTSITLEHL